MPFPLTEEQQKIVDDRGDSCWCPPLPAPARPGCWWNG